MAEKLSLRTPDDVRRLFSALGAVQLTHEEGALSVHDIDEMSLMQADEGFIENVGAVGITLLVVLASAFSAIRGFERNDGSMPLGLGWGVLGFLFPLPSVAYTAYVSRG